MANYSDFHSVRDFEKYALKVLPKSVADYYKSGADDEQTLDENKKAFKRLRLKPRFLKDVSKRNLGTYIQGNYVSYPIGIAPTAMHCMAHPDGEKATAKGAASEGVIMILSTLSTTSLEEVAKTTPKATRWLQLYIYKDREATKELVLRAERAGYSAIVLTVDAPVFGTRLADAKNKFSLPPHLKLGNFNEKDTKSSVSAQSTTTSNLNLYVDSLFDPSITWEDINWLKKITYLPIIIKGIMTAEDADLAVKVGISGIIVSNHGARQLDGVNATIEVLPEIVQTVANRCEVYLDGGVRNGTDVLKALALGAKAVFVGRPVLWGLTHSGEPGVKKILQILKNGLDSAMALSGCSSINDIKLSLVVSEERYSKI